MSPEERVGLHIHDMLDAITHIRAATSGMTFDRFESSIVIRLAVERAIEIVSEASRRIPDGMKAAAPHIPWSRIAGIGNFLRHEYREIAASRIWAVVITDLDPLDATLREMLSRLPPEE